MYSKEAIKRLGAVNGVRFKNITLYAAELTILKSEEVIEINNFKELCIYLEDMWSIYDAGVRVEWFSKADQNIINLVERDIKSRYDLFFFD